MAIKTIARTLKISRNTVRAALASDGPPKYERKPTGPAADAFKDAIRAQLSEVPTMPATGDRPARRLDAWDDGVQRTLAGIAAGVSAAGSGGGRMIYDAGDIAQRDLWFHRSWSRWTMVDALADVVSCAGDGAGVRYSR